MNEVSIIINGVRYDAVETDMKEYVCLDCDFYRDCKLYNSCSDLIGSDQTFKKSDKKFEK